MLVVGKFVRQVLLAVLLLSPAISWAEVRGVFDPSTGAVNVNGLTVEDRAYLIANQEKVILQSSSVSRARSMALSATEIANTLVISPNFPFLPGTEYDLRLGLKSGEEAEFKILVQGTKAKPPQLLWHTPNATIIPENTLRLYLMFSEPMAKGFAREAIWIERTDGTIVDSPFLNLSTELWDSEQRRLTLLFDPGRIKQGVGPNQSDGAPLQAGHSYCLVVSGGMKSAKGLSLNHETRVPLHIGAARRDAIDPWQWGIQSPRIGTRDPLRVQFLRVIDNGSSTRRISVVDSTNTPLTGNVGSDGSVWVFTPKVPWTGNEHLVVDPKLEDVAGNTPHAPFDASSGTIGKKVETIRLVLFE